MVNVHQGQLLVRQFLIYKFYYLCTVYVILHFLERGINSQNENTILNRTNKYRRLIAQSRILGQPKASNMKKLVINNTISLYYVFLVHFAYCNITNSISNYIF